MTRNVAPGYCIVEQPGTLDFHARQLFRDIRSPAATLFMQLNADTQWLKPGQMLIIADPNTPVTMQILQTLKQAKQRTNMALTHISAEEANFFHKHYGVIAGLTKAGNQIFSAAGDAGERYFLAIESTLKKIEESYQHQYRMQGTLISQQFFAERNRLLNELKMLVNKPLVKSLAYNAVKLRPYEDMRWALNLSSRSIVHEWSTAGVVGIPGYSTYVGNAAKAARFLKYGGFIGIGFSFAGTTNNVIKACSVGRENECGRSAFKEYTKFTLSTATSVGSGAIGATAGLAACAAIGIVTAGAGGVVCAAVGSLTGGYIGSNAAELGVDMIYQYAGQ